MAGSGPCRLHGEARDCWAADGDYNAVMEGDLAKILIPREQIERRVQELGRDIAAVYGERPEGLVIAAILSGSIIFLADLIRCLPFKMRLGLMTVSRYRGATTSGGETRLIQDLSEDIAGRDVLVVDDILDSGGTLREVKRQLASRGPASLRTCVLLRKTAKAPKDVTADFVGFEIEDVFVVGYGLDYDGQYRNWPDIGVLRSELYK
jgi:hypoxanthine phosphoribosyltransferase